MKPIFFCPKVTWLSSSAISFGCHTFLGTQLSSYDKFTGEKIFVNLEENMVLGKGLVFSVEGVNFISADVSLRYAAVIEVFFLLWLW